MRKTYRREFDKCWTYVASSVNLRHILHKLESLCYNSRLCDAKIELTTHPK